MNYWDDFLKDVNTTFLKYNNLSKILEAFWYYCNDEKTYCLMIHDFVQQYSKHDAEYWLERAR